MVWRRKAGRRRKPAADRPPRNWRVRGAAAAACAVLGYIGVTSSFANVAVKADAATAHALASGNGAVTAALAEQLFAARPDADDTSEAARLARRALLQDATAVEALTVLGFQAQLRGDDAASDRYFALGTRLSRRELRPQLWAIEEAVNRGNIAGALRRYDVALRTSTEAQGILFPILASALSEPAIRRELLGIMTTEPIWSASFIAFAAASGRDPIATAQFFRERRRTGLPVGEPEGAAIVNSLFRAGRFDEAWSEYTLLRPGANAAASRDPGFGMVTQLRTPFDWNTADNTVLSSAILETKEGGVLDFSVPSSVGGTVVSQVQMLPPGAYRLQGRSAGLDQPERSRPYWLLSCYGGQELGRVPLPNSVQRQEAFAGSFTVPAKCPVQTLSLVVRSTQDINGVSGQVRAARLAPARRGEAP